MTNHRAPRTSAGGSGPAASFPPAPSPPPSGAVFLRAAFAAAPLWPPHAFAAPHTRRWMDDWISHVYGEGRTFKLPDVSVVRRATVASMCSLCCRSLCSARRAPTRSLRVGLDERQPAVVQATARKPGAAGAMSAHTQTALDWRAGALPGRYITCRMATSRGTRSTTGAPSAPPRRLAGLPAAGLGLGAHLHAARAVRSLQERGLAAAAAGGAWLSCPDPRLARCQCRRLGLAHGSEAPLGVLRPPACVSYTRAHSLRAHAHASRPPWCRLGRTAVKRWTVGLAPTALRQGRTPAPVSPREERLQLTAVPPPHRTSQVAPRRRKCSHARRGSGR